MNKSNIYIGYNERLIFEGLSLIYSESNDFNVIGGTVNGDGFLNNKNSNCDIVLIELGSIRHEEIEYIKLVRALYAELPLMLLSSKIPAKTVSEVIGINPDGFFLKSCNKNDLINASNKLIEGNKYYCHKVTQLLYSDYKNVKYNNRHALSPREEEILIKVVNGDTNYTIADTLSISETTVKTHRKNIMSKLGATNIFALIRYACRENLIDRKKSGFCRNCPCRE